MRNRVKDAARRAHDSLGEKRQEKRRLRARLLLSWQRRKQHRLEHLQLWPLVLKLIESFMMIMLLRPLLLELLSLQQQQQQHWYETMLTVVAVAPPPPPTFKTIGPAEAILGNNRLLNEIDVLGIIVLASSEQSSKHIGQGMELTTLRQSAVKIADFDHTVRVQKPPHNGSVIAITAAAAAAAAGDDSAVKAWYIVGPTLEVDKPSNVCTRRG